MANELSEYFLDITTQVCPMTFVRTKLLVERMAPGETAEVRLKAGEALENVPRSLRELGHEIVEIVPEATRPDVYRLTVRKH
ncbi:MAG: sulfurtransferase TusA family protein [Alphaproteobacteria bacterium]|nr:sulfurtransferase TusA family protein [Alphaproteobacteria bacterium]